MLPQAGLKPATTSSGLIRAGRALKRALATLQFKPPVYHVYNPLDYAWACYEEYLTRFASEPKKVVFLGMNPGPFGMVQTGIPFGEVRAVREWLGIRSPVMPPAHQHPRRPVLGWDCRRSEVSGNRLWGLFAQRFGSCEAFFSEHLVLNYCPLAFMDESGRNRTPDKLALNEREALFGACDRHLAQSMALLQPEWVIGVGDFARQRAESVVGAKGPRVGQILHPSPANPSANRAWASVVTRQLLELGVWRDGMRDGVI